MLTGIVQGNLGGYWHIKTDDGDTKILRPMDFDDRQPIEKGQEVTLEYRTTANQGLWHARRVSNG